MLTYSSCYVLCLSEQDFDKLIVFITPLILTHYFITLLLSNQLKAYYSSSSTYNLVDSIGTDSYTFTSIS